MTLHDRARAFRLLHRPGDAVLVLPNAWDAMSARVIERAGAKAIATTSAGVSWVLGRPDGEGLGREEMLEMVRRMVRVVRVPVSADVEAGYGRGAPEDFAATVRGVIAAGAVGVNLEDGLDDGLRDPAEQAERIAAARAAAAAEGVELFINARVDVYLRQFGAERGRFDETVGRARAYVAAGADGIFVPGTADGPTIGRLAEAVGAPLNVLAGPGTPPVSELRRLGVARVSVGSTLSRWVMARVGQVAGALLEAGDFGVLDGALPYPDANRLFSSPED